MTSNLLHTLTWGTVAAAVASALALGAAESRGLRRDHLPMAARSVAVSPIPDAGARAAPAASAATEAYVRREAHLTY